MAPTRSKPRPKPGWIAVKAKLAEFDQKGLTGLGATFLGPYKRMITRAIHPAHSSGSFRISIAAARKAIASDNKAAGDPAGMAELLVFYCEETAAFSNRFGYADGPYFHALLTVFVRAPELVATLPLDKRNDFMDRLADVRDLCLDFDYGIGDDVDEYFSQYDNPDSETDSTPA